MEWIENKQEMKMRGYLSVLEREDSLYKIVVDKPSAYWAEARSGYYIEYCMNHSYHTDYSISVLKYDEITDEWTIPVINRFESTYEEMEEVVEFLKNKYDAFE
jgi:hypothetical protein